MGEVALTPDGAQSRGTGVEEDGGVRHATRLVPRCVSGQAHGVQRGGLRCPWGGKRACLCVDLRQVGRLCLRAGVHRASCWCVQGTGPGGES